MAYDVSFVEKSTFGNKKVHVLSMTADAATQAVDTGLSVVEFFSLGIQSCTTAGIKVFPNKGATGTSIAGYLGCSGLVSGDVLFVTVYGR